MIRRAGNALTRAVALLAVATVLLGVLPVQGALYRLFLVERAPRKADAIVILAGGVIDEESPTDVTTARLVHGLRLHRRGYAPFVILSGGGVVDRRRPEAGVMSRVAQELGADPGMLIVETVSNRTATQGTAVASLARARGIRSILLVTSPEHSFRATRVFAKAGLEVISTPTRGSYRPRLAPTIRPYSVARRLCGLVPLAYEGAAVALYWWRGWV